MKAITSNGNVTLSKSDMGFWSVDKQIGNTAVNFTFTSSAEEALKEFERLSARESVKIEIPLSYEKYSALLKVCAEELCKPVQDVLAGILDDLLVDDTEEAEISAN